MNTSNIHWYDACAVDDIPKRGAVRLAHGSKTIAIFRSSDNKLFAIDDACPHKGGPLSDGIVHGDCVTCPLHNWRINLESGRAEGSDDGCVSTYPVRTSQQRVYVELTEVRDIGFA